MVWIDGWRYNKMIYLFTLITISIAFAFYFFIFIAMTTSRDPTINIGLGMRRTKLFSDDGRDLSRVFDERGSSAGQPFSLDSDGDVGVQYHSRPMSFTINSAAKPSTQRESNHYNFHRNFNERMNSSMHDDVEPIHIDLPDESLSPNIVTSSKHAEMLKEVLMFLQSKGIDASNISTKEILTKSANKIILSLFEIISPLPLGLREKLEHSSIIEKLYPLRLLNNVYDAFFLEFNLSYTAPQEINLIIERLYWLTKEVREWERLQSVPGFQLHPNAPIYENIEGFMRQVENDTYHKIIMPLNDVIIDNDHDINDMDSGMGKVLTLTLPDPEDEEINKVVEHVIKTVKLFKEENERLIEIEKEETEKIYLETELIKKNLQNSILEHEKMMKELPELIETVRNKQEELSKHNNELVDIEIEVRDQIQVQFENEMQLIEETQEEINQLELILQEEFAEANVDSTAALKWAEEWPCIDAECNELNLKVEELQNELENVHLKEARHAYTQLISLLSQYTDNIELSASSQQFPDLNFDLLKLGTNLDTTFEKVMEMPVPLILDTERERVFTLFANLMDQIEQNRIKIENERTRLETEETKLNNSIAKINTSIEQQTQQLHQLEKESEELKEKAISLEVETQNSELSNKQTEQLIEKIEKEYKKLLLQRDLIKKDVNDKKQLVFDQLSTLRNMVKGCSELSSLYDHVSNHMNAFMQIMTEILPPNALQKITEELELADQVQHEREDVDVPPEDSSQLQMWVKERADRYLSS